MVRKHRNHMRCGHHLTIRHECARVRMVEKLTRSERVPVPHGRWRIIRKRRWLLLVRNRMRLAGIDFFLDMPFCNRVRRVDRQSPFLNVGRIRRNACARTRNSLRRLGLCFVLCPPSTHDRPMLTLPLPRRPPHLLLARVFRRHGRKRRRVRRGIRKRVRPLKLAHIRTRVPTGRRRLPIPPNPIRTVPFALASLSFTGFAPLVRCLVFVFGYDLIGLVGHERYVLPVHRMVRVGCGLLRSWIARRRNIRIIRPRGVRMPIGRRRLALHGRESEF